MKVGFLGALLAVLGFAQLCAGSKPRSLEPEPLEVLLSATPTMPIMQSPNEVIDARFFFEARLTAEPPLRHVPRGADLPPRSEPFGRATLNVAGGGLWARWHQNADKIAEETQVIIMCRADPAECPSPEALRFGSIIDAARKHDGRARIGEVNRSINLA